MNIKISNTITVSTLDDKVIENMINDSGMVTMCDIFNGCPIETASDSFDCNKCINIFGDNDYKSLKRIKKHLKGCC